METSARLEKKNKMAAQVRTAIFETSEYICDVLRIDGIAMDKRMTTRLTRCRDCAYNGTASCSMAYWDNDNGVTVTWNKDDDYCSRARKKQW